MRPNINGLRVFWQTFLIVLLLATSALAADKSVRSRPNSQGGETYYSTGKHPVQCRPNSQGGQTCHAI